MEKSRAKKSQYRFRSLPAYPVCGSIAAVLLVLEERRETPISRRGIIHFRFD